LTKANFLRVRGAQHVSAHGSTEAEHPQSAIGAGAPQPQSCAAAKQGSVQTPKTAATKNFNIEKPQINDCETL